MATSAIKDSVHCRECGTDIARSAANCPNCGARQSGNSSNKKSRAAAILLALFLGGVGAHKFYLGSAGMGLLYLLFFWTFIPAIIAFVEMIFYILMTDEDFHEKYG